ncbi:MAG: glycosyltransferase [Scytolyngbya sp. HA4215-MV1]|nr:glycosyltransferase [Scytolyngbya sp. HA4215-MV1]
MSTPLVSVIIPAYNAAAFIERTLVSVLSQTYPHLEVLVVDDGSTDRTVEIVNAWAAKDSRIRLLQQPNQGVAAARNFAIQNANGSLIAPIDADDIWYPENLQKQVQRLSSADETVGLVYSWSLDIDEIDLAIGDFSASVIEGDVSKTLVCHNFIGNASATLIRRDCFEKVGGYNCQLKELGAQGCEDWDLYLRISEFYQFQVVPEFLVGYRKVISSMSRNYDSMARSHFLMLKFARERQPATSRMMCRLSSSSFYLYLARQSRQHHCYRGTLFWLLRALEVDHVSTIFRSSFYALTLESYLKLAIKEVSAWIGTNNYYWIFLKQGLKSLLKQSHTLSKEKQNLSIRFKVLLSSLLHRSIPTMFG